jgi:hypothetical protein
LVAAAWIAIAVPLSACTESAECGEREVCVRPRGMCHSDGSCLPADVECPRLWDPACGCDRQSYGSPCDAEVRGVSVAHRGSCCVGACRMLDRVTVDDLTYGVAVGLGTLRGACQSFDRDQNQRVTIDELTTAVRNAMQGCAVP